MIQRLSAIALALLVGCSRENPIEPRSATELRAAPTSVVVQGQEVQLISALWRDFMPISPPDGQPLVAVLRLQPAGGGQVAAGVRADAAWVVFGNDVWATAITEERFPNSTGQDYYEAVIRNGPKWGPGVSVDVIVRVRDAGGTTRLLRAADQPINRTD